MPHQVLLRHSTVRALVASAATFALVMAPSAVYAADIEGTSASEGLVGTSGDDTIDAKDGDDAVAGDSTRGGSDGGDDTIFGGGGNDLIVGDSEIARNGGDDTIHGGAGNDFILGDGLGSTDGGDDTIYGDDGDDEIVGDGYHSTNGGNDHLYGGSGNDILRGDGGVRGMLIFYHADGTNFFLSAASPREINGGDDALFGGPGNDTLYGDSGNDILCGEDGHAPVNPLDQLHGGLGTDIACAIDDHTTVDEGVESTLDLAANDDALDDEADETQPLRYRLKTVPDYIDALLGELTGLLTFTASKSGTIRYEVCRSIIVPTLDDAATAAAADEICSGADVFITANPVDTDPTDTAEIEDTATVTVPTSAPTVLAAQVLPNTGASTDPRILVPAGLGLILAGALMLGTARRRTV